MLYLREYHIQVGFNGLIHKSLLKYSTPVGIALIDVVIKDTAIGFDGLLPDNKERDILT